MKLGSSRVGIVVFLPALLALGFGAAKPLRANTIYNNFGPSNSFLVNRSYETNFDFMATTFVTTGGGDLGTILMPIFSLNSPVSFGLYTSSGGQPGALLEDWSVPVPGFPAQFVTLTSVLNPFLSSGTQYWFVITLTNAQKNKLALYQNNQGVTGGVWAGSSLNGLIDFEPGSPAPAIQLNSASTSATPEPASVFLFGSGLLLLGLSRTKKRTGLSRSV